MMSMETYREETTINLLEDIKSAETKYNFKELLEKQNTHDLFCPNCRSCISRKVIFRKRREVPRSHPIVPLTEDVDNAQVILAPTCAAEDHENDKEPEVFRCLSCFSFFIPTGNLLKYKLDISFLSG